MFLEGMMLGDTTGKKKEALIEIKDFKENHTDTTVSFTIAATKESIDSFEKQKDGLIGKFKLKTTVATSNMQLFDERGRIIKYDTPEDILEDFYRVRLDFYEKRKAHLLEILRRERLMLANKARFVEEVCSGDLIVSNRKRSEILEELQERGYDLMSKEADNKNKAGGSGDDDDEAEEDDIDENASDADLAKGYEYLLGMKIWSLTYEKAEKLRAELEEKTQAVADLEAIPPSTLWWNDLDAIEDALDERDDEIAAANAEERKAQNKNKKIQAKATKKKGKKKKRADEWDSDMEDSDEDDGFGGMSDSDEDDFASPKKQSSKRAPVARKAREAPPVAAAAPKPKMSPKPLAKKPAVKKAATKKVAAKPAAKKPAAKKAAVAKKVKPEPEPEPVEVDADRYDSDSDSDVSVDLASRLKGKLMVSPAPKENPNRSICLMSDEEDEDEEDFSASSETFKKRPSPKNTDATPSAKPKAAKKAAPARKLQQRRRS